LEDSGTRPSPGGVIAAFLLGLVGAFIGLAIGQALGLNQPDSLRVAIAPAVGAVVVLALYRRVTTRRTVGASHGTNNPPD
jgi:uncharacterized membrane protein YeaQ/YmgE (transglycosylase-associated protein family)